MTETEFPDVKAGKWVQPIPTGYLMMCCGCGLVHRLDFRVVKDNRTRGKATLQNARYRVQFRAYRDD